jgi:N-methylhydantoinase B
MPGSGGHGDPLLRDPAAVAEDVRQEKITVLHALDAYGVVVDPETFVVDRAATAQRRLRGASA